MMQVEDIWFEYRARIKAFLHSKISNPADVDDLLQEISIKTFQGISALEDDTKVQPWLYRTAHRTIIDHYRRNGRGKNLQADDLWYSKDDPDVHHDLERCIEPFIAALPDEKAHLLTAIDLNGQSQKDYAAAQGITYSTVKSRVQSARQALRSVFETCCHLSLDSRGNIVDYRSREQSCTDC